MRELHDILEAFEALRSQGRSAVLASVVTVEGSTYRRPGARALIGPDGRVTGLVSGGCLEGDLTLRAERVAADGTPRRVCYDSRADEDRLFGLGLGCRGVVDVLLEPVSGDDPGPLDFLARCSARRLRGVLVTQLGSLGPDDTLSIQRGGLECAGWLTGTLGDGPRAAAIEARASQVWSSGVSVTEPQPAGGALAFEALSVRPRLVLLGAGPDAPPLVELARGLGWAVEIYDARAVFAQADRFPSADRVGAAEPAEAAAKLELDPRTAVVVMSHHYERDRAAVSALLGAELGYLGVLGPRARTEEMLSDLRASGVGPSEDASERLFGPAGFDIGAESPYEIALAIIAEIQATLAGHPGSPLRHRDAPIHQPKTGTEV